MNVLLPLILVLCLSVGANCQTRGLDNKTLSIITVLCNSSFEFRNIIERLIDVNLKIPAQLKKNAIQTIKAWTTVEPTPKETMDADRALNESFGLSSGFLPDTNEKMEIFCDEQVRNDRREVIRNYVIRKYTTNFMCRLAFNLIATRLQKRNDFYCSTDEERLEFVKHANEIKKYEKELGQIRNTFKLRLIDMQHTNLGISKARNFCCSFWTFRSETLEAIQNSTTKHFFDNMFESYFHLMTQYFCFSNSVLGCNSYKPPMNVVDPEAEKLSLAMNLIRATAKITSIVL